MNSVTVDSIYGTEPDAHEMARLPGEALDRAESGETREKPATAGTDGLFAEPQGRSTTAARNNLPLYAGVGTLALLMALGYVLIHPAKPYHPLQPLQPSTVHLAGVPPIAVAPLAPSASLANVHVPNSPPAILHQKYVPQPFSAEMSELDNFRMDTAPNNLGMTPPQGLPGSGALGAPPETLPPPPAIITHQTAQPASTGLLAPHIPPTPPNIGAHPLPTPTTPGSLLKLASLSPPRPSSRPVTPSAIAPAGQTSVPAKDSATAPPQPAAPPGAVTLAAAQAGALSPTQQTELLQLVTELATMERDDRIKQAVLTGEVEQLSALTTNKLDDYDRRLSMLEAQTAVSGAMQAGSNGAVEAAMAPAPTPAAANSSSPAGVSPPQAASAKTTTPTSTVLPSSDPAATVQYHVQAASPGLAMLSVVGGDGSPLEVQVGDTIPGYGKVLGVVQQGDSWVVQTQSGNIQ